MKPPEEVTELSRAVGDVASLALRHERAACAGYELSRLLGSGHTNVTIIIRVNGTAKVEARDVRGRVVSADGQDFFEALALCDKVLHCAGCDSYRPADWFSEDRPRCRECDRRRMAEKRSRIK